MWRREGEGGGGWMCARVLHLQFARYEIDDFNTKKSCKYNERAAGVKHGVAARVAARESVTRDCAQMHAATQHKVAHLLSSSRSSASRRPNSMGSSHSGCS